MGKTTLKNVTLVYGPYDLSGDTNSLDMPLEVEMKDCTTFGPGTFREYAPGILSAGWTFRGFNELELEEYAFSRLNASAAPAFATLSNPPAAEDVAYVLQGIQNTYKALRSVGEIAAFELSLAGSGRFFRGFVLDHRTATTDGDGPSLTLPAVGSNQTLYAFFWVTNASASDTLDALVESDADATYPSAVTRITFDQVTDEGWQIKTVAGPITDVEWRLTRLLGGTGPSFKYTVILCIVDN